MSGGTFDLSFYSLESFAEEVEQWVEQHRDNTPPLVRQRMLQLAHQARKMAPKIKAVDYFAAGDHGEEAFHQAWSQPIEDDNA